MTADKNSNNTCIILIFLLPQLRDWVDGGVKIQLCKSHNFWHFCDLKLGYIQVISCNFWSFQANIMKSHTMIVKTLSEHTIMVILYFWVKNVVFEQK